MWRGKWLLVLGGVVLPCGLLASAAALWCALCFPLVVVADEGQLGRWWEGSRRRAVGFCAAAVSSSGAASVPTGAAYVRGFGVPRRVPQPRIFRACSWGTLPPNDASYDRGLAALMGVCRGPLPSR
ncbi:hypothetical protein TraAM80_09451 [Trypanosoma rangeli]|uniref:Uncharacterized protein n=1 Tax=Trypanosoma rangeli TaxID=5698 RepID=A0A3R7N6J1_TRYRA|nr:uncharacterized protein TraAM80_09451 [Trypanosoma rangeli]RNE97359.1 hypothetical protein TraAM80_09451 [Trypanosoma rangeli]|eukprot:RNE97359.1 hypothetical protein TraAM80_09451 [Trypanosoma rangeli]